MQHPFTTMQQDWHGEGGRLMGRSLMRIFPHGEGGRLMGRSLMRVFLGMLLRQM
jgi:hypothetical protein